MNMETDAVLRFETTGQSGGAHERSPGCSRADLGLSGQRSADGGRCRDVFAPSSPAAEA